MRDWLGTQIQRDALTVACRYCHAPIGELCTNAGQPLKAFPAHEVRIRDAKRVSGSESG